MGYAPSSSWSRLRSLLPPSMPARSGNVKFLFDEWENKMNEKIEAAITYLRSRNKYVLDAGCNFVPTKSVQTDVAETIRIYRREVDEVKPISLVKGKKK
jgi:hypothetical protein